MPSSDEFSRSLPGLLDICSEPVVLVDPHSGIVLKWNAAVERVFAIAADASEIELQRILPCFAEGTAAERFFAVAKGEISSADLPVELPAGDGRYVARMMMVFDDERPLVAVSLLPADAVANNGDANHLPHRDPLTGLANRTGLLSQLDALLKGSPGVDRGFAVLFIDLDNFKQINDQWGHLVGDDVLAEVARRIAGCIRSEDTLVRYGGDEFIALLHDIQRDDELNRITGRIRQVLRKPIELPDGNSVVITASMGAAEASTESHTARELLVAADRAMYADKRQPADF